jgi:hypothetical protein
MHEIPMFRRRSISLRLRRLTSPPSKSQYRTHVQSRGGSAVASGGDRFERHAMLAIPFLIAALVLFAVDVIAIYDKRNLQSAGLFCVAAALLVPLV